MKAGCFTLLILLGFGFFDIKEIGDGSSFYHFA